MKKTVACCKNVLKDYWKSLRIDPTDKSQVWIEEAKRKQLVKFIFLFEIEIIKKEPVLFLEHWLH